MIFDLNNIEDRDKALQYVCEMSMNNKKIDIKVLSPKRSLKQNAYFHGVIVKRYAVLMGLLEWEAKMEIKKIYGQKTLINGIKYPKPTSMYTTTEIEALNISVRADIANNLGEYIPLPNDVSDEYLTFCTNEYEKFEKSIWL